MSVPEIILWIRSGSFSDTPNFRRTYIQLGVETLRHPRPPNRGIRASPGEEEIARAS